MLKFDKIEVSLCLLLSLVGVVMLIVFYELMSPRFANNETIPYPSNPLLHPHPLPCECQREQHVLEPLLTQTHKAVMVLLPSSPFASKQ